MPIDIWKDKQNKVCTYKGILFSLEKEWNSDTWNNMIPENVMLNEISQTQKGKYCIIPLIWVT